MYPKGIIPCFYPLNVVPTQHMLYVPTVVAKYLNLKHTYILNLKHTYILNPPLFPNQFLASPALDPS